MYLIVETVRQEAEGDKAEWKSMRQTFRAELGEEPTHVQEGGMEVPRAEGEVGEVGFGSGPRAAGTGSSVLVSARAEPCGRRGQGAEELPGVR